MLREITREIIRSRNMNRFFAIILFFITLFAEEDFLECVRAKNIEVGPTQSTKGEYLWIREEDTLEGYYFYMPPRVLFITNEDTVDLISVDLLHDPWFDWWIMRNPVKNTELFSVVSCGDSGLFSIYDYISLDKNYSVRVGYYRLSCRPGFALFYFRKELGHGFPGADEIYYEFTFSDAYTLAPKKRAYLNKNKEQVDILNFKTVEKVTDTPTDDEIIMQLLEKLREEKED